MLNNNFSLQLDQAQLQKILDAETRAAEKTANSIILEVSNQEIVPMDNGDLEISGHTVITGQGSVQIQYSTPYAAKQYFDASLDHSKGPHAGTAHDHWLDQFLPNGNKESWVLDKFKRHLNNEIRRI